MADLPDVVKIFDEYEKLKIDPNKYHTQQLPSVIVDKVRYWCGDLDLITRIVNDDIKNAFYDKYEPSKDGTGKETLPDPNAYWLAEIHYQTHKLNTTQIMEKLLQIGFMIYNRLAIATDAKTSICSSLFPK